MGTRRWVWALAALVTLAVGGVLLSRGRGAGGPGPVPPPRASEPPPATPAEPRAGSVARPAPAAPGPACAAGLVLAHAEGWPPVPGARILAFPLDGPDGRETGPAAGEALTGGDGRFTLDLPAPGVYRFLAVAPGHALAETSARIPGEEVRLHPRPGARLAVRAVDRDRRPVPGAVVVRRTDRGAACIETPCDADGRAEIDWGTFDLVGARAPGLAAFPARVSPPPEGPLVLLLVPVHAVAGTVTDTAGRPVAGAEVSFFGVSGLVFSDAAGLFRIEGLAPHTRPRLSVRCPGFAPFAGTVFPGDEEVRVVLRPPILVSGTVRDAGGTPVAGAQVVLLTTAGERVIQTEATGVFRVEDLEGDARILEANASKGPCSVQVPGPLPVDRPLDIVLDVADRSFLVLAVCRASGGPMPLVNLSAGGRHWRAGDDGRAVLGLPDPPGTEVAVTFSGAPGLGFLRWSRTLRTRAAPDGPPEVVLEPGEREVRFRVTGPDEAEVEGAAVDLERMDNLAGGAVPRPLGPLCFAVPEGVILVATVSAPGCCTETRSFQTSEDTAVLVVRLARAAVVRGRAPPGAALVVNGGVAGEAAEDGSFTIPVRPGRVALTVRAEDGRIAAGAEVVVAPGEVRDLGEIPGVRPRVVSGVVADEAGRPVGGAAVLLVPAMPGEASYNDYTSADGAFRFEVPDVGEWVLVAAKPGRAGDVRPLPPGAPSEDLALVCPRGGASLRLRFVARAGVAYALHVRFPGSAVPVRWPLRQRIPEPGAAVEEYAGLPAGRVFARVDLVGGSVLWPDGVSDPGGPVPPFLEAPADLAPGGTAEVEIRAP